MGAPFEESPVDRRVGQLFALVTEALAGATQALLRGEIALGSAVIEGDQLIDALTSDTIERTRAASIAWKPDDSGFYYTRYPKKGDVAEGQEMYNRHVFYHALDGDTAKDPLIFGEGRDPQDWPNVTLSNDGRWLSITVAQGWTKTELFLKDESGSAV